MKLATAISALLALAPTTALALSLEFPAMTAPLAERRAPLDSYFLATAPFHGEGEAEGIIAEGALTQQSWRVGVGGGLTTLQMLAPLRDQLLASGYTILYECSTRDCGGFDFRYHLDVLPEPDMHVNLGDFRYLAAARPGKEPEFASLIVSRSASAGFIQLTRVGAPDVEMISSTKAQTPAPPVAAIGERLEEDGYAVLDDLVFRTGSSRLDDIRYASLDALAAYLQEHPTARVTLVGHTDAKGALDGNVALSRRRAEAVATLLTEGFGIAADRVSAEGVGYLAPRASNLTDTGRRMNRRVEAILTTSE